MQFTKTLLIFLLPALALSSPTPEVPGANLDSLNVLDGRGSISVNVAQVRALQKRMNSVNSQVKKLSDSLSSQANALHLSGSAGKSFKTAFNKYRSDQARANADLAKVAKALGSIASSYSRSESANSEAFD